MSILVSDGLGGLVTTVSSGSASYNPTPTTSITTSTLNKLPKKMSGDTYSISTPLANQAPTVTGSATTYTEVV